jgi:hypothetical protein
VKTLAKPFTHWRDGASLAWVLALTLTIGTQAAQGVARHLDNPPDFDEAVHLLPVAQIANDLRRLDVFEFAAHTYAQDEIAHYPFFHSWLAAPFFVLGGTSLWVGRLASLGFLGLSIIVSFFLARALAPDPAWGWQAGAVGASLVAVSLPLWAYASLAYLEAAGWLVAAGTLWCYVKADTAPRPQGWLALCSLGLAAALFTKYSFGLFLLAGVAVAEAVHAVLRRRLFWERWLHLAWPVGALALAWFGNPAKVQSLLVYSRSQDPNIAAWSTESLLFYPRSLVRHYLSGPLSLGLVAVGLGLGLRRLREPRYAVMVTYTVAALVMVTLVPQKEPRFIYTVAPAALISGSAAAAWLAEAVVHRVRTTARRAGVLGLALALVAVEGRFVAERFSYLPVAQDVVYASSADTGRAYRFISAQLLEGGTRPHLLNAWHLLNSYSLAWEYYAAHGGDPASHRYQLATAGAAPEPNPDELDQLLQSLQANGVGALVSIDGSPAGKYSGWQVIEPLWAGGRVELLADSEPYDMVVWPDDYKDRVFAGDFNDPESWRQAHDAQRAAFSIRLHLYALRAP